jgi:hypothetical protein
VPLIRDVVFIIFVPTLVGNGTVLEADLTLWALRVVAVATLSCIDPMVSSTRSQGVASTTHNSMTVPQLKPP